jgi:hypothetical protein
MKSPSMKFTLAMVLSGALALLGSADARAGYQSAVLGDGPVTYHRFSESGITGASYPTFANSGTNGTADNAYVAWMTSTAVTSDTTNVGVMDIGFGIPGVLNDATHTCLYLPDSYYNELMVPYDPKLNVAGPFSVEIWLKGCNFFGSVFTSTDKSTGGWMLYQGDTSEGTGNGIWWRIYNGSTASTLEFNYTLNPTNWYHVVCVYDGANQTVYINGVEPTGGTKVASVTYTPTTTQPVRWGNNASQLYGYRGDVDLPAIYNYALTAAQAAAHYAARTNNAPGYAAVILADKPAGFWEFNEKFNPPVALNIGSAGAALNGAYYGASSTTEDLDAPIYPGLETTNNVLNVSSGKASAVVIPPLNLNTNAVTFECMIKPSTDQTNGLGNTSYAGVVVHRDVLWRNSACGINFASPTTLGYMWNVNGANTYSFNFGLTPPEGSWSYVALTISPTAATMYMYDGTNWYTPVIDYNNTSFAPQAFTGPTAIGLDPGNSNSFRGEIDEVAIYNQTLTPGQLQSHALAAFGGLGAPQPEGGVAAPIQNPSAVYAGVPFSLFLDCVGTNLAYQWQTGDGTTQTNIPGATNATYVNLNPSVNDPGNYDVVVTSASGSITSSIVNVYVNAVVEPSGVQVYPALRSVFPGGSAILTSSVSSGTGLSYQWQLNGQNVSGATNATLTLANLTAGQSGSYTVIASNAAGTSTSSPASTLTVVAPATGSYQEAVVADGPEGYWRLNDTGTEYNAANGVMICDFMGRHDGVCYGDSPNGADPFNTNTAPSVGNMSFLQPGIAGDTSIAFTLPVYGIRIPASPALNLASNFSYECWLVPGSTWTPTSGFTQPMGALDSTGDQNATYRGYGIALNAFGNEEWTSYMGNNSLRASMGTSATLFSNANFNGATNWTHVVCVESNTMDSIYINGVFAGSDAVLYFTNRYVDLWIGSDAYAPGTRGWNGSIAEAAYYPTILSPARILAHYELGVHGSTNLPIFAQPPLSQTVVEGSAMSFNAVVAGASTITYLWQFNGINIPSATGTTLSFASVNYTNAGQYTLTATNGYGGAASTVTLTVVPPASVTNLTGRVFAAGAGQNSLQLVWPTGTLYSSTNVAGPWSVVSGATLPYYQVTISTNTPGMFYMAH